LFLQNLTGLTYATGDLLYHNGTDLVNLGIGTASQVLATNAGADAPEWATVAEGGDVSKVGTPVDNQIGVWTGDGTIEGASSLTYDGTDLTVSGFVDAKSNYQVSEEGLVLGMNFNTETITGTAGSETVLDSSTYNNHGTNSGATHDPDGGFNGGGAFVFANGDDDFISVDKGVMITTNFTISFWEYTTSGNEGYFLSDSDDVTNLFLRRDNSGTIIQASIGDETTGEVTLNSEQWNFITIVNDGNSSIYVNGELETLDPTANNFTGLTSDLYIGNRQDLARDFDGKLDNLKIYNRVLSADEIKAQYLQRAEVGDSYVSQSDVFVDSSGNVGIGTDSPTATLHTVQTATTGNTLSVSRDLASASTDSAVASIVQDNVGDDQYALNVQQDGSASAIKILHQGNLTSSDAGLQVNISGTNNSNGSGIIVTDTGGYGTDTIGLTLTKNSATQIARLNNTLSSSLASNYFYRNLGSAETNAPLVFIEQDNAGDDQNAQTIQNDGTGNGLFIDQNNSGYGIDIDGDANSASDLTGLRVNVANAGAGEAYSAIFQTGNVGIGTSTPDTTLEVLKAGTQLKLSYDGTDNTTFAVDTNGDLTITPSGDEVKIAGGALTSTRITKRTVTATDDATAAIDTDSYDEYELSAIANATTFTVTGTPTDGQNLIVKFKDAGTTKGLTWTGFTAIGVTLPTTTVVSKWHYVGCKYNSTDSTWHAIAYTVEA